MGRARRRSVGIAVEVVVGVLAILLLAGGAESLVNAAFDAVDPPSMGTEQP